MHMDMKKQPNYNGIYFIRLKEASPFPQWEPKAAYIILLPSILSSYQTN